MGIQTAKNPRLPRAIEKTGKNSLSLMKVSMKFKKLILSIVLIALGTSYVMSSEMRIEARVSLDKAYVGQPVIYSEWLICDSQNIAGISPTEYPAFSGIEAAVISPLPEETVVEKGLTVRKICLRAFALVALEQGNAEIRGARWQIGIRKPSLNPFYGYIVEPVTLKAPERKIKINPLPDKAPSGFTGLVGQYSISYDMPEGRVEVGKNAQFVIRIEGEGMLIDDQLPNFQSLIPKEIGIKHIEAEPKVVDRAGKLMATADFICNFIPDKTGDFTLPQLQIIVFNPVKKKFETISASPVTLKVTPAPKTHSVGTLYV